MHEVIYCNICLHTAHQGGIVLIVNIPMELSMSFTDNCRRAFFNFENHREHYQLCDARNTFFQPYSSFADFQQQIRTTLVSPLVVLGRTLMFAIALVKDIIVCLIGLLTFDLGTAGQGVQDIITDVIIYVTLPVVTSIVTLASCVSLFTRAFGTLFPEHGTACDEFIAPALSLIPDRYGSSSWNSHTTEGSLMERCRTTS